MVVVLILRMLSAIVALVLGRAIVLVVDARVEILPTVVLVY